MKKIKLKRKIKKKNVFALLLILIIIFGIIIFNYYSKTLRPVIFKYALIEAKKFSNLVINDATARAITDKANPDEIFKITKDKNEDIQSVDFNTIKINEYLTNATKRIQNDMENLEKGNIYKINSIDELTKKYNKKSLKKGIIVMVSSGYAFKNPLISNLGPKIPVKVTLTGDVISYFSVKVEDYGINSSIIRVYVNFKVSENIILPFYDKTVNMDAKIPVAMKIITGKIPQYYFDSNKQTKDVVVPKSWL